LPLPRIEGKISTDAIPSGRSHAMPLRLCIEYPESLPDALAETRQDFEDEAKMAMAVKLFEMKRLSSGQAAQLAGVDRVTFLLRLKDYGVSAINLDAEDLQADFRNA
jgi:predicted HTH domain antitoxin